LDYYNKIIIVEILGNHFTSFEKKRGWVPYNLTSDLGANKLLKIGCQG